MRVDSWDEEDDQPTGGTVAQPTDEAASEREVAAQEGAAAAEEKVDWRKAVGTAPLWLTVTAVLTIGSMCVMFFTIMLLLAVR